MDLDLKKRSGFLTGTRFIFILVALFLTLGCGGGGGGGEGSPSAGLPSAPPGDQPPQNFPEEPAAAPGLLSIQPEGARLPVGGQQQFSATTGPPDSEATGFGVTWSIQEGEAGGFITSDGTYTAPARPGTYHVIAVSEEDEEQRAATEVTVISQGSIGIQPAAVFLGPGGKKRFSAEVKEAPDKTVTWGVVQQGGGTISEEGEYTAPTTAGTYDVTATGRSDPSLKGAAAVTVSPLLPKGITCNASPRRPYLAWVSDRSAVIAWRCSSKGTVRWGAGQQRHEALTDQAVGDRHFARLSGLTPGTTYSYEVEIDGHRFGQVATFTTAPAQGSDVSFIAFADSGTGTAHQRRLAEVMKRQSFDFALIAGDVIYDKGADAEFDPGYFLPYAALIDHLPFFPVPGNHDIVTDGGKPFRQNFYLPQGNFYYDFFWGETHLIGLDSNKVTDRKQRTWLETALQKPAQWKIVYFHHPVFSSGHYGDSASIQSEWVPLFRQHGVDLVITGHAHSYERTVPVDGITYVVTGGGGAWLHPAGQNERTAFSKSTYQFISVDLTENGLTLKAVDDRGEVIDTFQIEKPEETEGGEEIGEIGPVVPF